MSVLRMVIDIGSGMSKYVIAEVDLARQMVVRELSYKECSIPYGLVWKESGRLTSEVCADGLAFLENIALPELKSLQLARGMEGSDPASRAAKGMEGSDPIRDNIVAVGTEVFRKAENGSDFLKSISEKTGINVQLISQKREAELGFLSGLAIWKGEIARAKEVVESKAESIAESSPGPNNDPINGCAPFDIWIEAYNAARAGSTIVKGLLSPGIEKIGNPLIVYDSGGGSFQIVEQASDYGPGGSQTLYGCESSGKPIFVNAFLGEYGVAHATSDLFQLKYPGDRAISMMDNTANPCSVADLEKYLDIVRTRSLPEGFSQAPDWLAGKEIIAITGKNGIMRVAGDVVGKHVCGYYPAKEDRERPAPQTDSGINSATTGNVPSYYSYYSYTADQLRKAIFAELVDRDDNYLKKMFCNFKGAEGPQYIIPKVVSLLVVIEALKIKRVHWRPSVGSCPGMLIQK